MPADEPPPVASVIVLGYNGRRYAEACVESLLDQEPGTAPYEVIWADNGSSDGSADFVAERFPAVRLIRFELNLGYAGGNVRALEHARARFVAFLNQDTIVGRRWVRGLLEAREAAGAAAVHSNMILPWEPCASTWSREEYHPHVHVAELTRGGYVAYRRVPRVDWVPTLFVSGAGFMVDRDVLPEIGGLFDPDFFAYGEDTDLALRLFAAGHTAVIAADAVLFHDLTPAANFTLATLKKTARILRNRYLAFLRCFSGIEMLAYFPVIVIGTFGKVREIPLPVSRRVIAILVTAALLPVSLAWALIGIPRHWQARSRLQRHRVVGRFRIVAALWRGVVHEDLPGFVTEHRSWRR